jgi:hypothetical protein
MYYRLSVWSTTSSAISSIEDSEIQYYTVTRSPGPHVGDPD